MRHDAELHKRSLRLAGSPAMRLLAGRSGASACLYHPHARGKICRANRRAGPVGNCRDGHPLRQEFAPPELRARPPCTARAPAEVRSVGTIRLSFGASTGANIEILSQPKHPMIRGSPFFRRDEMARISNIDKMSYSQLVRAELQVARLKMEKLNKERV